jgi:hypothetical protein
MPKHTFYAILLIASCALSTGATAQNVYKCGSSYSQDPCPGGAVIDVADRRTSDQKKQTDMAASSDTKTAERMEKSRLQQEKADRGAQKPLAEPTKKASTNHAASPKVKTKKQVPDNFTAQVPGEKKKTMARKTASKSVK